MSDVEEEVADIESVEEKMTAAEGLFIVRSDELYDTSGKMEMFRRYGILGTRV